MWASGLIACFYAAGALLAASGANLKVDGRSATQREFFLAAGPMLLVATPALALTCWGINRRRPWTRYTAILFWLVSILGPAASGLLQREPLPVIACQSLFLLPPLLASLWYFFLKSNVTAYYRRLQTSSEAPKYVA